MKDMIEEILDVGLSMFFYLAGAISVLYLVSTAILSACLYLPVPIRFEGSSLYYRDNEVTEHQLVRFSVIVVGQWSLVFLSGALLILFLGVIGIMLGVPALG